MMYSLLPWQMRPLKNAASNDYTREAERLLALYPGLAHDASDHNETPLFLAAREGSVGFISVLLGHGGNIDHRNENWFTPLYCACINRRHNVAALLLSRGANPRLSGSNGTTPLMLASYDNPTIVRLLVEHGGSDIGARASDGKTALHCACLHNDEAEVVATLLAAGADALAVDDDGNTPLAIAVAEDHEDCVQVLQEWERAYLLARARRVRDDPVKDPNSPP